MTEFEKLFEKLCVWFGADSETELILPPKDIDKDHLTN